MKIFSIAVFIFLISSCYCFGLSQIQMEDTKKYINERSDSMKIETETGFLWVLTSCDSNSKRTSLYIQGEVYRKGLDSVLVESEKLNINEVKGYVTFEINENGNLTNCFLSKPSRLVQFNIVLQKLVTEVILKYKGTLIWFCHGDNVIFELPFGIDFY